MQACHVPLLGRPPEQAGALARAFFDVDAPGQSADGSCPRPGNSAPPMRSSWAAAQPLLASRQELSLRPTCTLLLVVNCRQFGLVSGARGAHVVPHARIKHSGAPACFLLCMDMHLVHLAEPNNSCF